MSGEELKGAACPFCGCPFPVINRPIAGNVKLSVKCPSCHSHGGYGATEAEAIAAWNIRARPLPEQPQEGEHIADAGKMVATHPNTDQGVTAEDREAARPWLHQYLRGSDIFALADAFARHRLSSTAALEAEIASLKQRLESAGDRIADAVAESIASEFRGFWDADDLVNEIPTMIREAAVTLLQEQEKQNG